MAAVETDEIRNIISYDVCGHRSQPRGEDNARRSESTGVKSCIGMRLSCPERLRGSPWQSLPSSHRTIASPITDACSAI